ncbi:flagellum-specific ATP synthase FliI, partial [Aquitalea sp. S1-19]|nr:flagellum-specific ATP synthase FliI [Aquitalea sp. S1-19]
MSDWLERQLTQLQACRQVLAAAPTWRAQGHLTRVTGLVMEAVGLKQPVGSACLIHVGGGHTVEAEVVGFSGEHLYLMPVANIHGLLPGALVEPLRTAFPPVYGQKAMLAHTGASQGRQVPVGMGLMGRVLDALGRPLDGKGAIVPDAWAPLYSQPLNPLARTPVREVMDVGVRAINGLLTVGRGQRLGLFAGSGVGKSVLLGMMARFTRADVVVVGLIGERGREVKDFIENILGEEGLAR